MNEMNELSRRSLFSVGGVGAVAATLALAGCSPSSPGTGSSSSGSGNGGGESSGSASSPPLPASGTEIAALSAVAVGDSIGVVVDGASLLVAQPVAGEVVAFSAICSHQQCVVGAAQTEFLCPCHGSRFDAATGDVINGPALNPLTPVPVSISGDKIVAS